MTKDEATIGHLNTCLARMTDGRDLLRARVAELERERDELRWCGSQKSMSGCDCRRCLRTSSKAHYLAKIDAEIERDAAIKERDALREDWSHYVGPCPHGRDPWTRCDESDDPQGGGCGNQSEPEAMRRALAHAIKERDEARAEVDRLSFIAAQGRQTSKKRHELEEAVRRLVSFEVSEMILHGELQRAAEIITTSQIVPSDERERISTTLRDAITDAPNPEK